MRIPASLAPFLAALLLIGCAQGGPHAAVSASASSPAPFAPKDGGYTVNMPGSPKEAMDEGAHMATSGDDDRFYMVRYKELDEPVSETGAHAQRLLDRAARTWAEDEGRRAVWQKKTHIDGHPARDLLVKTKDGDYMRVRIALKGSRLYQVLAVTGRDDPHAAKVAPFIDSFHFTGK